MTFLIRLFVRRNTCTGTVNWGADVTSLIDGSVPHMILSFQESNERGRENRLFRFVRAINFTPQGRTKAGPSGVGYLLTVLWDSHQGYS